MSRGVAAMIWCPFPDTDSARTAASKLVEERLIACGNIIPQIESVFRWKGEVETSFECGLLCKTDTVHLQKAVARLERLHPYETPAIMGFPVSAAAPATLGWLAEQLGGDGS
ncbi:divalent-cation tolerance protein CutA [Aurantiacibacter sediminis]|uniref:Divalent-cation tolerance protein CutA n=1 Tax=Aurantiacibacter sediminis TaxID=2793064 RepID=A0ABS0N0F1_9SPHN|nr:divalent-cation tolerance protein CutA [Aurantiacibacter sediminis]MBH5321440.1 divalent-cation tolerance protein CutA [Aurantiacibacter sediminis]